MDPAEISRRLKAARWLAGDLDEDGKARALPVRDLAQREPLIVNRITANRIEDIEQQRLPNGPRQMELEKIAQALGAPADWFVAETLLVKRNDSLDQLQRALADLGLAPPPSGEEEPSTAIDTDHSDEAGGGGRG